MQGPFRERRRGPANRIVFDRMVNSSSARSMTNDPSNLQKAPEKPHYTWPWFVLGAVLLGLALAVLWMSREVERLRLIRDVNAPPARTDFVAPRGP